MQFGTRPQCTLYSLAPSWEPRRQGATYISRRFMAAVEEQKRVNRRLLRFRATPLLYIQR